MLAIYLSLNLPPHLIVAIPVYFRNDATAFDLRGAEG